MAEPDRMADATLIDTKARLRSEALARRDALPPELRRAAAETIASRAFPLEVAPGAVVSGFSSIGSEINPVPLMRRLADQGALLALPVVVGRGRPLVMRAWAFGEPLGKGVWGIREPSPEAAEVDPDTLLVPLAAFDRAGHRIGYGAGYYDLTLAGLRSRKSIVAIGLAYGAQEIPAVPTTARDARLDLVLTEREVIDFRKA
jgi:5-formyltetrahydrofolate cyclo-ligase